MLCRGCTLAKLYASLPVIVDVVFSRCIVLFVSRDGLGVDDITPILKMIGDNMFTAYDLCRRFPCFLSPVSVKSVCMAEWGLDGQ